MTHGSLFSGIGAAEIAAEWVGWRNAFHCEINPFCQRVLNYYWPHSQSYSNVTTTDFSGWRGSIDVLTGGFPCQPYSVAGKREGKDDQRHLWPEMLRAIREIAPTFVVGENVRGLVNWRGGMVFDQICSDLEAESYEVIPFLLPACGVNAPHRRYRIFFVAYSGDNGHKYRQLGESRCQKETQAGKRVQSERIWANAGGIGKQGIAPNATIQNDRRRFEEEKEGQESELGNVAFTRNAANTICHERSEGRRNSNRPQEAERHAGIRDTRSDWRDWENFPTQPPVCGGNDGLPTELDGITFSKWRRESMSAYGNAIVPQVLVQIFKAIQTNQKWHV